MRKKLFYTAACIFATGVLSLILLSGGVKAANIPGFSIPCGDSAAFITAINAANSTPEEDILHLAAGCTYIFYRSYAVVDGEGNALPVITSQVVIEGHGATLLRSTSVNTPSFRFFEVHDGGILALKRVTLRNGGGPRMFHGGAVLSKGSLSATDSVFWGNIADQGGALYVLGKTQISSSLLHENTAEGSGGALTALLPNPSGETTPVIELTNTTIKSNRAMYGYALALTGSAHIINSTIYGNLPVDSGSDPDAAIKLYNSPVVKIGNSILSNGTYPNCSREIEDLGGNLESTNLPTCGNAIKTGNPLLLALDENGGPTKTMALLRSSPAEGAGIVSYCPPVDQRGAPRNKADGCDAGAYEIGGMITSQITVVPDAAKVGTVAQVTISLTHNTAEYVNALELDGALPDGLRIADLPALRNTCAGTFSATPGEQSFSLKGATLPAGQECQLMFSMSGTAAGQYVVSAGTISSPEGGIITKNAEADFVVKMDTKTALDCCDHPASVGSPVVITVQVNPITASLAVPQGVVKCKIMGPQGDLYWIGDLHLFGGNAETWVQFDRPGPYLVDVMYSGSRIFNPSPAASHTITVQHGMYFPIIRR